MEQFSLLTRMVEIVTVTHKLLISICHVVFSGLQALRVGTPHNDPACWRRTADLPGNEPSASAFWREPVLPHQPRGGFYLDILISLVL